MISSTYLISSPSADHDLAIVSLRPWLCKGLSTQEIPGFTYHPLAFILALIYVVSSSGTGEN